MPPHRAFPGTLLALSLLGTAASLRAELIKVSPFANATTAAAAPAQNTPVEYRGYSKLGGVEQFRIVMADQARKVGAWLKLGERDANLDVVIKQADADRGTVTIEHGGQTLNLPLKVARVVSSGAPMPVAAPPPVPAPNVLPAVINTVTTNPTQADEARRLDAVAAEVARRRALREQQAQQAAAQPGVANPSRQEVQQSQQIIQPGGLRRQ